ncbi:hypothetical protein [Streptomyces sp. NPDC048385]|uniref:hypothetical protein n=1 Tax=unclassified Streptomyces TaxID=2593676 RepID=UPI003432E8A9
MNSDTTEAASGSAPASDLIPHGVYGGFRAGAGDRTASVTIPATGQVLRRGAHADRADTAAAISAVDRVFPKGRDLSPICSTTHFFTRGRVVTTRRLDRSHAGIAPDFPQNR